MKFYILKDKIIVEVPSLLEWAQWMETTDRTVAKTKIGCAEISTVFLGLDQNFFGAGDPLLFETIVFLEEGGVGRMARYFTWAEAENGHTKITALVRQEQAEAHFLTIDTLAALMVDLRTAT